MVIVMRCEEGSVAVGDDGERETEFSHTAPCHPAQYRLSNQDTLGTEESVLISEVS